VVISDEAGELWLVERGDVAFPIVDKLARMGYKEVVLFKEDIMDGVAKDRDLIVAVNGMCMDGTESPLMDVIFLRHMDLIDCYNSLGKSV
jgi:hypothetical protein